MDEKGFILNFERIRMEATILREIQYYQEHDYPFDKGKSILVCFVFSFSFFHFPKKIGFTQERFFQPSQAFLRSSLSRFSSETELWSKSDALRNDKVLKKQTSVRMPRLRGGKERPSSSYEN